MTKRVPAVKAAMIKKVSAKALSGRALLKDMEAHREEVTATPEAAMRFLFRIGVVDKSGRRKRLIRD